MKNFFTLIFSFNLTLFLQVYAQNSYRDIDDIYRDRFINRTILGPMTKINTLSFRLFALEQGADMVYTEEIPDYKLARCTYTWNAFYSISEFFDKDRTVLLQTHRNERGKLVLQLGISSTENTINALRKVRGFISGLGITINAPADLPDLIRLGESFITDYPDVKKLVNSLKRRTLVPISCNLQVMNKVEETVAWGKILEKGGVDALILHDESSNRRNCCLNENHLIEILNQQISIPVIPNYDSRSIKNYCDVIKLRGETNFGSLMISETARYDVTIFNKCYSLPSVMVIRRYLLFGMLYNHTLTSCKYFILDILKKSGRTFDYENVAKAEDLQEIYTFYHLTRHYNNLTILLTARHAERRKMPSLGRIFLKVFKGKGFVKGIAIGLNLGFNLPPSRQAANFLRLVLSQECRERFKIR